MKPLLALMLGVAALLCAAIAVLPSTFVTSASADADSSEAVAAAFPDCSRTTATTVWRGSSLPAMINRAYSFFDGRAREV